MQIDSGRLTKSLNEGTDASKRSLVQVNKLVLLIRIELCSPILRCCDVLLNASSSLIGNQDKHTPTLLLGLEVSADSQR